MPLSKDTAVVETSETLVKALRGAFQTPPSHRPAHARGILARGTFKPTADAAKLSNAPHFTRPTTPVIVRFSSSTGNPHISDLDPQGQPGGFAVRFVLSDDGHTHTDIVGHSTPHFPVSTLDEFLAMITAIGNGTIGQFLGEHPTALRFVQAPKPFPASFGTQWYYALNAFKLLGGTNGTERFVRYRFEPVAGASHLSDEDVKAKSESYLHEELVERVRAQGVRFRLLAQMAEASDITDNVTEEWPESRDTICLGELTLDSVDEAQASAAEQKKIIFDPIPRVQGIEPSADPLLEGRATLYLISGRIRRAA